MYIDPHTEFQYENDEKQAKITMVGLAVSALLMTLLMIAILKSSVTL